MYRCLYDIWIKPSLCPLKYVFMTIDCTHMCVRFNSLRYLMQHLMSHVVHGATLSELANMTKKFWVWARIHVCVFQIVSYNSYCVCVPNSIWWCRQASDASSVHVLVTILYCAANNCSWMNKLWTCSIFKWKNYQVALLPHVLWSLGNFRVYFVIVHVQVVKYMWKHQLIF
jgi:hypothetical protein